MPETKVYVNAGGAEVKAITSNAQIVKVEASPKKEE